MGSSLPERPQSSRLSSIGPESEQTLLSQHGGWWKSKSSNTTVATRPRFPGYPSVPPCGNLFLPIFTLWEVLFPPLLSARSSTGEVGAAPILLEWNQVLHASFYFFDDFEWKNLGGKENELRPQWLSPHRWAWGEGEQLGKWEARRSCREETRSAQQGALFVNLTIWLLLYKPWSIASHPKLNR